MKNTKHSDLFGIVLILFGVFLIACWMAGWFEAETVQWLWILLLYFWIGYMSGEIGSLHRTMNWGFETGFVGSDSINTRHLIIASAEGKGGISIINKADGVFLSIQDGQGEPVASIEAAELAIWINQYREKARLDKVQPEDEGTPS
jgi:TM2 domain-containing membrane protein YozV